MKKLQAELDKVAEERREDDVHFLYEEVKNVEYLQACIDEALRIHSTSALGLPRVVPAGGAEVCGRWFPEGTTLSVPVSLAATHVKSPMT
jgi:benzoate 4-monooxygenase